MFVLEDECPEILLWWGGQGYRIMVGGRGNRNVVGGGGIDQ